MTCPLFSTAFLSSRFLYPPQVFLSCTLHVLHSSLAYSSSSSHWSRNSSSLLPLISYIFPFIPSFLRPSDEIFHFCFCCRSPFFFPFYIIPLLSDPLFPTPSPNNSNRPFFDASFMVLFPNALSISFTATLSNLHHLLLSRVRAFYPAPPPYCLVLRPLAVAAASWPFLFRSLCSRALCLTSSLLLQPFSLMLLPTRVPLVPFSITLTFLFHFFLPSSPPPPSPSHPFSHSPRCVTECRSPGPSNGIILYIRAAASVRLTCHSLKVNLITEIAPQSLHRTSFHGKRAHTCAAF